MKFVILCPNKCGSKSLAVRLDRCESVTCVHEHDMKMRGSHAWIAERVDKVVDRIKGSEENYGEACFYHLWYLEVLMARLPELRVICLRRDEEEWMRSFMHMLRGSDPFTKHSAQNKGMYPRYTGNSVEDKAHLFYEMYYTKIDALDRLTGRILQVPMYDLNSIDGLRGIYDFLKIPEQVRVYSQIHENKSSY